MSHDVLLVERRVPIASELVEANLKIEDKQQLSARVSQSNAGNAER